MVADRFRRLCRASSFSRRTARGGSPSRAATAVDTLEARMMLSASVVISEFMASNTKTLQDQDGNFSDWIELHNTTAAPVSIEGWHLTDDKLLPAKWTFPAVTLPADGYLVVFASQKDRAVAGQQLHTNFNLAAGGEYLALFPPEDGAEPASEFDPFPKQQSDASFGLGAATRSSNPLLTTPAPATYLVPTDGILATAWTAPGFDDTTWTAGQTGIGYEATSAVQPPLPEESEPNDATAAADDGSANFSPVLTSPGEGATYQMSLKGTISLAGDTDYYNVGVLQAGDMLTVSMSGNSGSRGTLPDTYLEIYRLNGGTPLLVVNSDDDGPGLDSLVHRMVVRADDTYYVRAMGFPAGSYTGTYALGLSLEDAAATAPPATGGTLTAEAEGNNDVTVANNASASWRTLDFRSSTAARMDTASDTDLFKFRFTAGDVVTILADSTSAIDARLTLLNSGGVTVVAQDDGTSFARDDGTAALDSRLVSYVVPSTGTYFVRVQAINSTTGTYRLELDLSTRTAPPTPAWFSGLVNTKVEGAMRGVNASAYVRVPFTVANDTDLADVELLTLAMKYDDGFVAYLNGTEVARRNTPSPAATPAWDAAATTSRDNAAAARFENFDISAFRNLLVVGTNVLAVHGLNASTGDADFLVLPEVRAVGPLRETPPGLFLAPTPGSANGPVSAAGVVADTHFDHDRGFYTQPFDLAIATDTPDAHIRYTLNGDTPTATTGTAYTGAIRIDRTTTIRAMAFKPGYFATNVDTQTYIFLDDVIRQSPNGVAPAGWPTSWGANVRDYGMDPDVVNNVQYRDTIKNDLQTIPTMSLVMDLDDLFNPTNGIYANPRNDGRAWERPASLELINPDGTKGFQADAGVRVRGGFSRDTSNPKHAFRFFFRSEYGQNELDYPLFGPEGANSFKGFDLRTFQNYSWSYQGDARGIFMRDQLSRDLQLAMGQPAERGDYYHLYINGQYWGLYNTDERPEANYGASYFGGKAEDYDVIKVDPDLGYSVEATDGNLDAWGQIWQSIHDGPITETLYQRLQGNNPNGTPNPALPVLLDMDNLIDYSLVAIYGGNLDAPVSAFLGDQRPNNFFAVRNRNLDARQGFRFFIHDAEHTLLSVSENRTGPFSAGSDFSTSNPHYFFQRLWANPNFRLRVTDHVQKHMVDPGGALTPAAVRESFLRRKEEIDRAVVAESARWGDSKVSAPLTRNSSWLTEVNRILNNYIPQRTGIVITQLRGDGLYPSFGAPLFNRRGGTVAPGFEVTLTRPAGAPETSTVYYTTDGSDPRRLDGTVNPAAVAYAGPLTVNDAMTVKARILNGGTWSPLAEATFAVDTVPLRVTELMYHPEAPPAGSPFVVDDFEFLELQNVGTTELDLSGVHFDKGITYTFPGGTTLAPGAYAVLVRNAAAFASRYGDDVAIAGTFAGGLSDSGENIRLLGPATAPDGSGGATLMAFRYSDAWEPTTDGRGRSLVPRDPAAPPEAWDDPIAWRRSAADGGSPGEADADLPTTVVGRWLYYNRSGYDGAVISIADSSDDNARATDKTPLFPGGGRATFANVSNYFKGINGLFIDLADLPPGPPITAADFEFNVGPGGDPSAWEAAPAPTVVSVRRGAGVGGSDRVTVIWPDSAIKNQWLRVTLKATPQTGLAAPDVFYFGNLAGDSGDAPAGATTIRVNAQDLTAVKRGPLVVSPVAPITNRFDFDRDGRVNATDLAAVKVNINHVLAMLDLSAPAAAGARGAAAAAVFSTVPVTNAGRTRDGSADVLGSATKSLLA